MKKQSIYFFAFLVIILFFSCSKKQEEIKKIDYYNELKSRSKLTELVKSEIQQNKKVVLYFYADWCEPCREFKSSLAAPLMKEAMQNSILIMIDGDRDYMYDTLSVKYGIHAYPTFVMINEKGDEIKQITSAAWEENIPENIAPVMKEFLK